MQQLPKANNLETFRILFIIKGILNLLISFGILGYVYFIFWISSKPEFMVKDDMPFNPLNILLIVGSIVFLLGVAASILTLLTAKYIRETRNYNFIFVMAIINCFSGLLGILLGVFTLIELNKPHVKVLFGKGSALSNIDSNL